MKYRVVSNRTSYEAFETKEEANFYRDELSLESSFYGSDEWFWVEEEE